MALFSYSRMDSRTVLETISKIPSLFGTNFGACTQRPKIIIKQCEDNKNEGYDLKNARLKRPMSPHLTIYSPQLTSVMSITHRFAGILLSGYFAALGIAALILPNDISHYIAIIENLNLSSQSIFVTKAVIAAPLGYHFANGIRHLLWDTGKGLTIKEVYNSGYAAIAVTLITTFFLAAL